MANIALRTFIELTYRGVNISREVSGDLVSFSYTDNESGTADDLEITLKNNHGRWSNEWHPTLGDKITATIKQTGTGAGDPLFCGSFTFDEWTDKRDSSGATVTFSCQSAPVSKDVKNVEKSRAWEDATLSEIAKNVADNGGLELYYQTAANPRFDRRDQSASSDLSFLSALCESEALNMKITDDKLVIFSAKEMDAKPAANKISNNSSVLSHSFKRQEYDAYTSCVVEYNDPATGRKRAYTARSENKSKDGKELKVTARVSSREEAERLAKAKLYEKEKLEVTASLVVIGSTRYMAGQTVTLDGFGKFSGKYKISKVRHSIQGGYTCAMDLYNVPK